MRITHVRVGRLVTTGNYSNKKVELEAEVHPGEDYAIVYLDLARGCEALLEAKTTEALRMEADELDWRVRRLKEEVERLEGRRLQVAEPASDTPDAEMPF